MCSLVTKKNLKFEFRIFCGLLDAYDLILKRGFNNLVLLITNYIPMILEC